MSCIATFLQKQPACRRLNYMNKKKLTIAGLLIVAAILIGWAAGRSSNGTKNGRLQIVAAENMWGSLVRQLGGDRVQVTSVVSDPNADPHEYSSSAVTARAFAGAKYVVVNGAGYDSWADKLLAANAEPGRKVLVVADLLGKKNGDNPHFWYDPAYVLTAVHQMDDDLIALDPANASYYRQQLLALLTSLGGYQARILAISQKFAGTKVAATEDIFAYLAAAAKLDLISPSAFTQAVAEGNDPPASSVVTFQQQLRTKAPAVLVFNSQTVTPLTDTMKQLAAQQHIPVVPMSEIAQPANATFQAWMDNQIAALQRALQSR